MKHKSSSPVLLAWEAPEYAHYYRGKTWYIVAGVFILAMVTYGIVTRSASTSIAFLLLAGVYVLTIHQEPKIVTIQINGVGIFLDSKFFPFNHMKAFWIVHKPPYVNALHIRLIGRFHQDLIIQLANADPAIVRENLISQVPEWEGQDESMTDLLSRILRL